MNIIFTYMNDESICSLMFHQNVLKLPLWGTQTEGRYIEKGDDWITIWSTCRSWDEWDNWGSTWKQ